jgi:AbrB family looped-hinge helix DNA binding protein
MHLMKITKKGQMTIPVKYRRKYNLREGVAVQFKETEAGLVIEPVPDIADAAGSMAKYGDVKEVLADLMRRREEPFR